MQKLEKDYQTEIEASIKEYQTKLQTYSADTFVGYLLTQVFSLNLKVLFF